MLPVSRGSRFEASFRVFSLELRMLLLGWRSTRLWGGDISPCPGQSELPQAKQQSLSLGVSPCGEPGSGAVLLDHT